MGGRILYCGFYFAPSGLVAGWVVGSFSILPQRWRAVKAASKSCCAGWVVAGLGGSSARDGDVGRRRRKGRTLNIQHRTSNIELDIGAPLVGITLDTLLWGFCRGRLRGILRPGRW